MSQVGRKASMADVIMTILDGGLRTTAVVGDEGKLIGVITEGDVLRAVARGSGPGLKAEDLMNVSPGFVMEPLEDEDLVRQFLDLGRLAVPVIDADGCFIRLEPTASAVDRLLHRP